MDQRINEVSNLKSEYSKRTSVSYNAPQKEQEDRECWQDIQYILSRNDVLQSPFFVQANKHIRIRLLNWIQNFEKIKTNKVWKTNRNHYIKLMKLMCQCEYLTFPFNALPSSQDLPTLKKHEINMIIDEVEREVKALKFVNRKMSSVFDSQGTTSPKWCSSNGTNQLYTPIRQSNKLKTFESVSFGEEQSNTKYMKSTNLNKPVSCEQWQDQDYKNTQIRRGQFNKCYEFSIESKGSVIDQENDKLNYKVEDVPIKLRKKSMQLKDSKNVLSDTTNYSRSSLQNIRSKREDQQKPLQKNGNVSSAKPPINQKSKPRSVKKIEMNFKKKVESNQKDYFAQKQYWMSMSGTGNNTGTGTPKYFEFCHVQSSLNIEESLEMISFRSHEGNNCDCTDHIWGSNWFSKWFKTNNDS